MAEIDNAIKNLANNTADPREISIVLSKGISLLAEIIEQLKEQNADLIEDTEKLIEKIDELEIDQQIILKLMQDQGIDMSYIVRKDTTEESK